MAPVPPKKYDYLVIGAGSGGIASVRRAGEFGIKGAVIEKGALGGTCVSPSVFVRKYFYIMNFLTLIVTIYCIYFEFYFMPALRLGIPLLSTQLPVAMNL